MALVRARSLSPAILAASGEAPRAACAAIRLVLTFDPHRTPKVQLEGEAEALARAARVLEAQFGPPAVFQGQTGWNLSRRTFEQAERRVLADAAGLVLSQAAPHRRRMLLPVETDAPLALFVDEGQIRFLGYGRAFVLAGRQAQATLGDRELAGRSVRFAYYGTAAASSGSGRSSNSPQP